MHDWDELQAICVRDGYRIKSVTEDPVTGARRVEVERTGVGPKTKAPVTGTIKQTIYPKDLTAAQTDEAGDLALKSAANKEPGTKLDPAGSKTKADGSPADGFFEAAVKVDSPPRSVKIQGWLKETREPPGIRWVLGPCRRHHDRDPMRPEAHVIRCPIRREWFP